MAGPGKGLPKKTSVTKSPRRSARLTPTKSSSGFHLRDEEVNDEAQRSVRNVPNKSPSARAASTLHGNLSSQRNVNQRAEVNVEAQVSPRRSARLRQETNVNGGSPPEISQGQRVQVRRSLNLTTTVHSDDHIVTPTSNEHSREEEQMGGQSQEQEEAEQTENASSTTRGVTRNLRGGRKRRRPVVMEVDEEAGRFVGADSQFLITEIGCVMRQFAKMDGRRWKDQPANLKQQILEKCTVHSNYDGSPAMAKALNKQLQNSFKSWKNSLHDIFLTYPSKEEAIEHVPQDVKETDWIDLCNHFDSDDFLVLIDMLS